MSTVAATTSPIFVPSTAPTVSDAGTKWAMGISPDGATVFGTDATGNLYESTDFTGTWSASLHQFATGGPIESIQQMANGEAIVAANDGKIWISTGWATSHATATWANTLSSFQSQARYPGRYGGVHVASDGTITACQWGSHTHEVSPATNAALYAHQSKDNGQTWTLIFDLLSSLNAQLVAAGLTAYDAATTNLHTHSAAYDPIWKRTWLSYGDNQSVNLKAKGFAPMVYKDDDASSWSFVPWPNGADDGNSANFQCTTPVVMDGCVFFLADGYPHGIIRIGRAGYRQMTNLEILSVSEGGSTGATGRRSVPPRQPGLPAVITIYDANPVGTDMVYTTADGYAFQEIFRRAETTPASAVSTGGRTAGPESAFLASNGQIIGALNDGGFAVASKFTVPYLDQ